jgi:hypothetical protein
LATKLGISVESASILVEKAKNNVEGYGIK